MFEIINYIWINSGFVYSRPYSNGSVCDPTTVWTKIEFNNVIYVTWKLLQILEGILWDKLCNRCVNNTLFNKWNKTLFSTINTLFVLKVISKTNSSSSVVYCREMSWIIERNELKYEADYFALVSMIIHSNTSGDTIKAIYV